MRRPAVIFALVVASLVGLYTLWSVQQTAQPANALIAFLQQILDYLILPGIIAGVIVNASVHVASKWTIVVANFILYFGLSYGVARYWERRKAKSGRQSPGA